MERLDGSLRAFLGFHGDKGKPARLAAEFVHDQIDAGHGAVRGEQILEIVFGGVEGEVSYKQFRVHDDFLSLDWLFLTGLFPTIGFQIINDNTIN